MSDHKCLHEVDLALMAQAMKQNTQDTKEILTLLKGDNSKGLVTKVALLGGSLKRAWWFLAGISMAIIGAAFFVIRGAF